MPTSSSPWRSGRFLLGAAALLSVLAGAGTALHGLLSAAAAALPYPDPTPELLSGQQADIQAGRARMCFGLGLLGFGLCLSLAWLVVRHWRGQARA